MSSRENRQEGIRPVEHAFGKDTLYRSSDARKKEGDAVGVVAQIA
jgi:hypothetical protein